MSNRLFIIKSPNLTFGPPGTTISGDKLRMTDEKLDAFVDAGHAIEVGLPEAPPPPPPEVLAAVMQSTAPDDDWSYPDNYDPKTRNISQVKAFVEAHPEHAAVVLEREQAGNARFGLVSWLENLVPGPEAEVDVDVD